MNAWRNVVLPAVVLTISFYYLRRTFDQSLKSRDPSWGVRDLEAVCKAADEQGLELVEKIEMPANNLSLLFRKRRAGT
jgi:pyruvate-formate lyase-activating enzyme